MNARIKLSDIAARLTTQLAPLLVTYPSLYISTAYDPEYTAKFAQSFPAIWVVGQRLTAKDDGRGFTGIFRQHVSVEIAIRTVLRRADTKTNHENGATAVNDAVSLAVNGWTPPGADFPLAWRSGQDGAPHATIIVFDHLLVTQSTYQGATP